MFNRVSHLVRINNNKCLLISDDSEPGVKMQASGDWGRGILSRKPAWAKQWHCVSENKEPRLSFLFLLSSVVGES